MVHERFRKLWPISVALFLTMLATGCGTISPPTSVTPVVEPVSTATIPLATLTSTTGCILTENGNVHGSVTQNGRTPPDNVYVEVIFSGGPVQRTLARSGQYAFPLLARQCPDGVHWVGFDLRAAGVAKGIFPTTPDVQVDLDVGPVPSGVSPDLPDCTIVLGAITGRVLVQGSPAPNGTVVTSEGDPGMSSLGQTTSTRGGHYTLPSIWVQCGLQDATPLTKSIKALGKVVSIAPTEAQVEQDIQVS